MGAAIQGWCVPCKKPCVFSEADTPYQGRLCVSGFSHSLVSYFFEPLLRHHNSDDVETFCYACSPMRDETTLRLQRAAHHWRDISALDDRHALECIRADCIDILVDLAGHTAGNRLLLFTSLLRCRLLGWVIRLPPGLRKSITA